jgi:hypothetical protein
MGLIQREFGIAILICAPIYFLWEVHPWIAEQTRRRSRIMLIVFMVVGASLGAGAWWWMRKNVTKSESVLSNLSAPQPTPSLPHLKLSLIIDSVTDKEVSWHIEPETDRPIEKIHTRFVAENGMNDELGGPFDRSLSPGDKMSILGMPGLVKPHTYNRLNATIIYGVVGNLKEQFASTFQYFFMADTPKTVAPEGIRPTENLTTSPGVDKADAAAALRQRVGTMFLALPERTTEGRPNVVSGGNSVRTISFDPVYGTASFRMKFPNGKSVTLTGPLRAKANGLHVLIMTWDESKELATLMVDDVPAKVVK